MGKNVIPVNDINFEAEVLQSPRPVLVDFSATWCGPCKRLEPIIESVADQHTETLKVAKIDVDDSPGVAERYGVRAMPTLMVFNRGKVAAQHVGLTTKDNVVRMITSLD
jgi:thioredoxin 1